MWWALTVAASLAFASVNAAAEESVKVGLILPMTGPFTTTGKQVEAGARFYMQQNGASVVGRKIEIILRDDAGIADNSKRIAQELLTGDKVNILAGFGLTPITLAVAPLATETRTPMVVMAAATGMLTERSPGCPSGRDRPCWRTRSPARTPARWPPSRGRPRVRWPPSSTAPGPACGSSTCSPWSTPSRPPSGRMWPTRW